MKNKKRSLTKIFCCLAFFLYAGGAFAQEEKNTVTLEQCYRLAEATYPLSRQRGLIEKTKEYNIENIAKGVYPQLSVNGTATYQSDVTNISRDLLKRKYQKISIKYTASYLKPLAVSVSISKKRN